MKVIFNKEAFLKDSQANLFAPRYAELKAGNVGEWFIALLFVPIFGWFWYPPIALGCMRVRIPN